MSSLSEFNAIQNTSNWYEIRTAVDLSQFVLIEVVENGESISTSDDSVFITSNNDGSYSLFVQFGLMIEEQITSTFSFYPTIYGYTSSGVAGLALFGESIRDTVKVNLHVDERDTTPEIPTGTELTFMNDSISFQGTILTFGELQ